MGLVQFDRRYLSQIRIISPDIQVTHKCYEHTQVDRQFRVFKSENSYFSIF